MPTDDPSGVPIVGPGTPYITPAMLVAGATGIAWTQYPNMNATTQQQYAAQLNVCTQATGAVDAYCFQPLRATVNVETFTGPGDFRCQVRSGGVGWLLASRSPVGLVLGGRSAAAWSFPAQWQTIPADQFRPAQQLLGVYNTSAPSATPAGGQGIVLAPGYLGWWAGRQSTLIETTYTSAYPHASLTASATAGATAVTVDDITGWEGAYGTIYDGGNQETALVTAVTPATADAVSGPGTLTLNRALTYAHAKGILFTCMPPDVQRAAIYFAVSFALTRGATATSVQATSGATTGGGSTGSSGYVKLAQAMLSTYRLTI